LSKSSCRSPLHERLGAKILAVQHEQVEGDEDARQTSSPSRTAPAAR